MITLPPIAVTVVLAGLYGLLVLATFVIQVIRRARPGVDLSEVATRTRSWWIMVTLFSLAIRSNNRRDSSRARTIPT